VKPVGDGLFTVAYGKEVNRTKAPPRTITIPDSGEFKVLKGDFHMHTLFSDGLVMPKDRVNEAIDNGLDVIAITDHIEYRPFLSKDVLKFAENNDDHNAAYKIAKPEAEKNKLIIVHGTEITKKAMHFNALFVNDVNPIAAVVNDWRAMLAVTVDQGGFLQWNHPCWIDRDPSKAPFGLKEGDPMRFLDEIEEVRAKGHLHGVEVFNASSFYPIALDWCNDRDLAPVTVTDIHQSDWNQYGHQNLLRPITLIFAKDRSYESVREALFAKRTVGWAANMILGRPEWVEKLFRSSVEIKSEGNRLTLQNLSDIPCLIGTSELVAKGTLEIAASKKITVNNWFVGNNKPLEITL
jgi:predicted metal-dependent phosphoesterase TrpH